MWWIGKGFLEEVAFEHSSFSKPFHAGLVLLQSTANPWPWHQAHPAKVVDVDIQPTEHGQPTWWTFFSLWSDSAAGNKEVRGTDRFWVSSFWEKLQTQTLKAVRSQMRQTERGETGLSQKKRHFYCPTLGPICREICWKVAHSLKK